MKKKASVLFREIVRFGEMLKCDNIDAFATHAAYFFILSFIPLVILLMSLLKYTNVTQENIMSIASELFPGAVDSLIADILDEVYNRSVAVVSMSAIFTLWSAGKGFMALKNGLHAAVHIDRRHSYFFLRIMGTLYALIFVAVIVVALVLGVFGGSVEQMIESKISFSGNLMDFIIQFRKIIMLILFIVLFMVCYRFIPDWEKCSLIKNKKIKMTELFPGAAISAIGWHAYSFAFSVYMKQSKGFENMYGSLAALIGIMLWLYGCMYLILAGLEINIYLRNLKEQIKEAKNQLK